MAAKPVERFVKKQIADQGGWPRILERIASGETLTAIASTLRRAGLADREQYGESKPGIQVTVNSATLHVDALRHRMVDASRPLVELLSKPESSAADSERGVVLARVEQSDTGGDSFSTSAAAP